MNRFSLHRLLAVLAKEFIQMRRDRLTFAMMVGIPILQLCLFGFAINTDPKHLPTAVVSAESSEYSRRLLSAMALSDYFELQPAPVALGDARGLLAERLQKEAPCSAHGVRGERDASRGGCAPARTPSRRP